jgi:hypothetical protein
LLLTRCMQERPSHMTNLTGHRLAQCSCISSDLTSPTCKQVSWCRRLELKLSPPARGCSTRAQAQSTSKGVQHSSPSSVHPRVEQAFPLARTRRPVIDKHWQKCRLVKPKTSARKALAEREMTNHHQYPCCNPHSARARAKAQRAAICRRCTPEYN